MREAEFNAQEAQQIIWWLVHLLGGRVTIAVDPQFWDTNLPEHTRLSVDNDAEGNPVLVAEKLDWVQN
jgi:hypothetical protein